MDYEIDHRIRYMESPQGLADRSVELDPDQLLCDATRPNALVVTNGGVPTRPESGRIKHELHRMDSSLDRPLR